jgi:tRNA(Ile)-lysidine synthase
MRSKVFDFARQHDLFSAGETVVVGVSGGADSVATLRVLHEMAKCLEISLVAAHINHGFRGDAARHDATFVASLCRCLGIPCYVAEIDVPAIIASQGGSPQQVSREQRLAYFRDVAQKVGASTLILGHHQDDQVETILLHLVRGSGSDGLVGMRAKTVYNGLTIVRPLLAVSRKEVLAYLELLGQPYCVDASNFKEDYTRNYMRLRVIPSLREINPSISEVICRLGALAAEDSQELWRQADKVWHQAVRRDTVGIHLAVQMLCEVSPAISRRLIRRAWEELHLDRQNLEFVHVEAIMQLCTAQMGRHVNLPADTVALAARVTSSVTTDVTTDAMTVGTTATTTGAIIVSTLARTTVPAAITTATATSRVPPTGAAAAVFRPNTATTTTS